jgi:hypothetical protein
VPYSTDALDALGVMAGSDNAARVHHEQLFELFDAIVRFQPQIAVGRPKDTEEGRVYEFGREIEFDTRIVPSAVRGLERICASRHATPRMRIEIAKRLLVLWEGVSKLRVVWGPAAVEALIGAMCSAACAPDAATLTRVRLSASLIRFLNKITVIRSIGEICSRADADPVMQQMAVEAGEQLLDEWDECELQDDERRAALLHSVGRIAANPTLDGEGEATLRMRERALQALFRGLREGVEQTREPLLALRDCPGVSPDRRREIDERLSKAFGLVRVNPSA